MDSTRDEENEYSSIDYNCFAVDREFTNLTSRSQLKSSEGSSYEESSSAVKKWEQKMLEPGETLPLVKNKEGIKNLNKLNQESICSIKCGLLILFILLTSVPSLFFCLHYLEVMKAPNSGLKTREVDTQKETMLNEVISKLKNNESVILLGGWLDYITNSITIYNSMEKSWKNCNLTLPSTLASHGAAILNNEIYIFGGYDGITLKPLKSLYKLGADNKWEKMADMIEKRDTISQSSVVFNSEIWVIGGHNGANILKSAEKYNPKTNSWTEMPELNESRIRAAATVVDGKIYVSGGWGRIKNSVVVYDIEKGKWEIFTNMPYEVDSHILIGNSSHLIAIGGDVLKLEPTNRVWKMDVLDSKREWKEMPNLRQGRYHSGAAIIANELMVFGGLITAIHSSDSVEIFDGVEWKKEANLPDKRGLFASIPLTYEQERLFLKRFCQNS